MKNFTKILHLKKNISSTALLFLVLTFQACNKPEEIAPRETDPSEAILDAVPGAEYIDGSYIVVFKEDRVPFHANVPDSFDERRLQALEMSRAVLKEKGIPEQALFSVYGFALTGFAAKLTQEEVTALRADQRVAYIEKDQEVRLIEPMSTTTETVVSTQTTPIGIKRVGGITETYPGTTRAYVIDTGILLNHPDLNVETERKRMYNAFCDEIVGGVPTTCEDSDRYPNDANGHGTHVAGTIGAKANTEGVIGVAPGVRVVPVKVLGSSGSGSLSNIIEGLDFVHYDAVTGDVANMSLGSSGSTAMDDAVKKVADKGVLFAIAAGNDAALARNYSPARVNHTNVFTIAAMSTTESSGVWKDAWARFSNYGQPPIDYIAPGVDVNSTYVKNVDGVLTPSYAVLSGTSMAAPHVAGLLVLNKRDIKQDGTVNRTSRDVYKVAHRVGR